MKNPLSASVMVLEDSMLWLLVEEDIDRLIAASRSDRPAGRRALLMVLLRPLDGAVVQKEGERLQQILKDIASEQYSYRG